eukprot:559889-Amphidinium_carterae.1
MGNEMVAGTRIDKISNGSRARRCWSTCCANLFKFGGSQRCCFKQQISHQRKGDTVMRSEHNRMCGVVLGVKQEIDVTG